MPSDSRYKGLNFPDYDLDFEPALTVEGKPVGRRRRVGDRLETAQRLLVEASEVTYDPELDIAWDAPLDPNRRWLAPENVSLFATTLWDGLTERQRTTLGEHELVSMLSFALSAQSLIAMFLFRDVVESRALVDDHVRFLLASINDESRNATALGRLINKSELHPYQFPAAVRALRRSVLLIPAGRLGRGYLLLVEELVDQIMRQLAGDPQAQLFVHEVAKIYTIAGRRHIRFARDEVRRALQRRRFLPPVLADVTLAVLIVLMSRLIINPQVYRSVGIDPRRGRRAFLRSGRYRRQVNGLLGPYLDFVRGAGLLTTRPAQAILRAGRIG